MIGIAKRWAQLERECHAALDAGVDDDYRRFACCFARAWEFKGRFLRGFA